MRDVREIVGYLDRVLSPLPLHEPRASQTARVGDQIALKKGISDDSFVVELWPALPTPPANPVYPTDIIDQTKVTRIRYSSHKYPDGVGFIKIDSAEVIGHSHDVEIPNRKMSLITQHAIPLFRRPNEDRKWRLKAKAELGHDIRDPRFRT